MSNQEEKDRIKQSRNRGYKKLVRKSVQKFKELAEKGASGVELKKTLSEAQKVLDKATNKKIIHKNKAARNKSKLHKILLSKLKEEKEVSQKT